MPLVPVDSARIRHETRGEYEAVMKEVEKARDQLQRFQDEDVPKFAQWLNTEFGALLTEIREVSRKLEEQHGLMLEVEQEVMFNGVPHHVAYKKVLRRRQHPEEVEKEAKSDADWLFETLFGEKGGPDFEDEDFQEQEFDFGDFHQGPTAKQARQAAHEELGRNGVARLKELYRAVVRKLHPDKLQQLTPQKTEWWHLAQEAYERGDAEQLEVILSLCEIEEAGHTEKASLWVLKRLIQQFRNSLRQIRSQITAAKKDPAWNFGKRKDLTDLQGYFKRQLSQDLQMIQQELAWVESQLKLWSRTEEYFETPRAYPRRRRRGGQSNLW